MDHVEKTDDVIARAKEVVALFKDMAKNEQRDKTVLAVSHGWFLHCLVYVLSA